MTIELGHCGPRSTDGRSPSSTSPGTTAWSAPRWPGSVPPRGCSRRRGRRGLAGPDRGARGRRGGPGAPAPRARRHQVRPADPAPVLADALERLAVHGIRPVAAAAVSVRSGTGLDDVRSALARLADAAPVGDPTAPVRLWVDRSFTVTGVGTVVTGTLPTGSLRRDDLSPRAPLGLRVRGLEVHGTPVEVASGPTRVAVNLRGVPPSAVPRGSALTTPARSPRSRCSTSPCTASRPAARPAMLHAGTTTPVRIRPSTSACGSGPRQPLASSAATVPCCGPGAHRVLPGGTVLEADPPAFVRRGDAARRRHRARGGGGRHASSRLPAARTRRRMRPRPSPPAARHAPRGTRSRRLRRTSSAPAAPAASPRPNGRAAAADRRVVLPATRSSSRVTVDLPSPGFSRATRHGRWDEPRG